MRAARLFGTIGRYDFTRFNTTEALITDIPEKEKAAPPMPDYDY
jgi:hypothetical protein